MAKEFKIAASVNIKPAGVATYMARKAIADWLRMEADALVSNHNPTPGGYVGNYSYAGPDVLGGETVTLRD